MHACIYSSMHATVEWGSGRVLDGSNCSYIRHFEEKDEDDLKPTEAIQGVVDE